jgi:Ca-activated chloride channel family protein
MRVNLSCRVSDPNLDARQGVNQRQIAFTVSSQALQGGSDAPLNLCLILDHSGSMGGTPLNTVRQAAVALIEKMEPTDYVSVIGFDHKANVVVPNQSAANRDGICQNINRLKASGGTCIDDAIKLSFQELNKARDGAVSQAFLLTDGENEHGSNERCVQFAQLAAEYNITLHSLGFGDNWNQDILEQIADAGGGSMVYIPSPDAAMTAFAQLLRRAQSVGLTNAYLIIELTPGVSLAATKPIAQVAPDTIELNYTMEGNAIVVRLGDLMDDTERVILANVYIANQGANLTTEPQILSVYVRYDDPAQMLTHQNSPIVSAVGHWVQNFTADADPIVYTHVLALGKYRQTQLAEQKLQQGDTLGAATMLQSAAKTALQMGDHNAATVLQQNATRLQSGTMLNDTERKKTRMVSKTVLQMPKDRDNGSGL